VARALENFGASDRSDVDFFENPQHNSADDRNRESIMIWPGENHNGARARKFPNHAVRLFAHTNRIVSQIMIDSRFQSDLSGFNWTD